MVRVGELTSFKPGGRSLSVRVTPILELALELGVQVPQFGGHRVVWVLSSGIHEITADCIEWQKEYSSLSLSTESNRNRTPRRFFPNMQVRKLDRVSNQRDTISSDEANTASI